MKNYLFTAITLIVLSLNPCLGDEYDVYLLAGQSNMDGRGKTKNLTESQRKPSSDAIIYYRNPPHSTDGWKPLAPGFSIPPKHRKGLPSETFGPEIGFAAAMHKAQPKTQFALIKGSKGGTNLRKDWYPGEQGKPETQGPCYRDFIATIKLASAALTKDRHQFKIQGLLWHQGESDSKTKAKLIARIREDLAMPKLPWVVGEVYDNGKRDNVRAAIGAISKSDPLCGLVSSEGTKTWDAGTHFDAKSQLLLGKRYAESILKLTPTKK